MSDGGVLHPGRRARAVPLRLRSDEHLARQSAVGDTDAFAALYERHHRSLYRYCRSIVADPDDAADALQSTMTRALVAIGDRDQTAPVRAWFFRIAHNESISVIRRRRTAEPLEADSAIGPDVAADAEMRGRLSQLVSDLQELSERQRGALLMRELSGLSHVEIAAALEVTVGSVKQSIFEARTALHDFSAGREMECATVQRELSDGDGRTARSRQLRGHLRSCAACTAFRDVLKARRAELAVIAPVLPAATAAAVLEGVIGGGGGGTGGGGLLAGLLGGGISKTVAVGAATVTAGAGTATYTATRPDEPQRERKTAVSTPGPQQPQAGAVLADEVESGDSEPGAPESRTVLATDSAPKPSERRAAERETARDRPAAARTAPLAKDAPEPGEREEKAGKAPSNDNQGRGDDAAAEVKTDSAANEGRGRANGPSGNNGSPGGENSRPSKPVKVPPPPAASGDKTKKETVVEPPQVAVTTPAPSGDATEGNAKAVKPTLPTHANGIANGLQEEAED